MLASHVATMPQNLMLVQTIQTAQLAKINVNVNCNRHMMMLPAIIVYYRHTHKLTFNKRHTIILFSS